MSEIEKMKRYIERTRIQGETDKYDMRSTEWIALANMNSIMDAIALAFNYGRAKGERHARKELKKV